MTLSLRAAGFDDIPLLAEMNKRLIEDEGSRNPAALELLIRDSFPHGATVVGSGHPGDNV